MSGWAYMLRCSDDSLYAGSTSYDDVHTRVDEHNDAKYIGYTSRRRPVVLVWAKRFDDLRDAHGTERRLKGWSRAKKLALIASDAQKLKALSKRRAGRPADLQPKPTKREASVDFHAIGARKQFTQTPPRSRHPEVRAQRAPKESS
ncbi:MAG: GIY-YIG nuclease family protein [Rhizomicrobium sp.]